MNEQITNIKNRKEISITGVKNVVDFDESKINIEMVDCCCLIKGKNLLISKFDCENEVLEISGDICEVNYKGAKEPIFKRLFK